MKAVSGRTKYGPDRIGGIDYQHPHAVRLLISVRMDWPDSLSR
jgi:hypothetical protein